MYLAAGGPRSAELAGRVADGMIGVVPDHRAVEAFETAGGHGKPRLGQVHVCWAEDEAEARRTAARYWPRAALGGGARRECRERVLGELRDDGRLPQVYGGHPDDADAAGLLMVIFRLLDRRDRRAAGLVDAHLRLLGAGPFLYRYEPGRDDGFAGVEGAFVPCSWWAVSALAALGRLEEAEERADALCAVLPPLLPEEIDPGTGLGLGNTPLVWSHMEMARALHLLDAAAVRRRFGVAGVIVWRLGRHLRARVLRPGGRRRR